MNLFAQIGEVWDAIVAIWDATMGILALWPWFLAVFVGGLVTGALMGWKGVLAVLTLGVSAIAIWLYSRGKSAPEPVEHFDRHPDRSPSKPKPGGRAWENNWGQGE